MIDKFSRAGLLLPLLFTVVGLVILISLGNWQMERKVWKANLIDLVNKRIASSTSSFEEVVALSKNLDDIRFRPVTVKGVFDHTQERHYFLPFKGKVGWHVITPLKTEAGDVVLIDRGFVPEALKDASLRSKGLVEGPQVIEGLVRLSEEGNYFSPLNDVRGNKWYVRDVQELYASLKGDVKRSFPFMIDQKRIETSGEWPRPGVTKVKFSDKHLGYALTWYGLALTLIGVFIAFAFSRLRK
ncbi:SURF1 family protein [Hyphomicrobiales bacterium 4NK60-0047b]